MSQADRTYAELLQRILREGEVRSDRTGVGTKAIFGHQMRFQIGGQEFPLLTTKRVFWRGVVHELLWFLRGETNIRSLQEEGVHIWDEWADENGDLGPVYGSQWRRWDCGLQERKEYPGVYDRTLIDQIQTVINRIRSKPDCRRLIVSAWNPAEIDEMKLPPCHVLFQFDVTADGRLNCQLYQRSCDVFLGLPFNIASYALLTRMVALVTGLKPGELIWTGGNTHIYLNHMDQVAEQLSRSTDRPGPGVGLNTAVKEIDEFTGGDIFLINYDPMPAIKAEVAV